MFSYILFFTDSGNKLVRKVVLTSGQTTTMAENSMLRPFEFSGLVFVDDGSSAVLSDPSQGILYRFNMLTREWQHLSGAASSGSTVKYKDGSSNEAIFNSPLGLAYDKEKGAVLVCDEMNHAIRRVQLSDGATSTIVGRHDGCFTSCGQLDGDYREGVGRQAAFNRPSAVSLTPDGAYAVVADTYNHCIRLVHLGSRTTSLLVGKNSDPILPLAFPKGVTSDHSGIIVYIADTMNNRICSFNRTNNEFKTIAGPGFQDAPPGTDGVGSAATFSQPMSLAATPDGWLLIADFGSHRIRMLPPPTYGVGYDAERGFTLCPACSPGTLSKFAGAQCEACPVNSYSPGASERCLAS